MPRRMSRSLSQSEGTVTLQAGLNVASMVRDFGEALNAPYLKAAGGIAVLIMQTTQGVKTNKTECLQMARTMHDILCAIINICGETDVKLAPAMIRSINQFSDTLQRILVFVRNQAGAGLMTRIARHLENTSLLSECRTGLQHAVDVFGTQAGLAAAATMAEMREEAVLRHRELVDALEKTFTPIELSSAKEQIKQLHRSKSSLLMLPASPQIFHGRENELHLISVTLLQQRPAWIAILGPGGIGKSSLVLAALHQLEISSFFGITNLHFISCETSHSASDLTSVLAVHFGLEQTGNRAKNIIRHIRELSVLMILVLDNLDTPWEPLITRAAAEDFLCLLADIPHLSVIVTMRGAERPGQVKWTRPFLPPLRPLDAEAACATFVDISDTHPDDPHLREVLRLTDNLPLAVTLMASLASFEGCSSILRRWQDENTSLLSDGIDKQHNLNNNILVSLSSPRMTSSPASRELLALLSLLPDGLTDSALKELGGSLSNISQFKTTLCRTSLAFVDRDGRLKALTPIREFMRSRFPPPSTSFGALRAYLYDLVSLFESAQNLSPRDDLVARITSDLSNIRSVISYDLAEGKFDFRATIICVIQLARYTRLTGRGSFDLFHSIHDVVDNSDDNGLRGQYFLAVARIISGDIDVEAYLSKAISCFKAAHDSDGQAKAYDALAFYYINCEALSKAEDCTNQGLSLAKQSGNITLQSWALFRASVIHAHRGSPRLAVSVIEGAKSLANSAGNIYLEAQCIRQQSEFLAATGDLRRATELANDAMSIFNALGFNTESALYRHSILTQAEIHYTKTEYEDSRKVYASALNDDQTQSLAWTTRGWALLGICQVGVLTGEPSAEVVLRNLDEVRQIFFKDNNLYAIAICDLVLADLYFFLEEYHKAIPKYQKCLDSSRGSQPAHMTRCFERLGDIAWTQRHFGSSLRYNVSNLAISCKTDSLEGTLQCLRRFGDSFLREGDEETALTLFKVALDGFEVMDVHQRKAECRIRIGDILWRRGNAKDARGFWKDARLGFGRSSQSKQVDLCDERLRDLVG